MAQEASTLQKLMRRAGLLGGVVLVVVLGVLGWQWQAGIQLDAIDVVGAQHADADELRSLAAVQPDTALYDIEPALVSDRVTRHPWVEAATTYRLPTGTLRISVTERTPVALALAADGTPAFYLDRQGYCMPLVKGMGADVPLLRGLSADEYHPVRPLQHASVRAMMDALATSDVQEIASELEVRPDSSMALMTRPTTDHGAIRVMLGASDFPTRLRRLNAFWHQAVLPQPNTEFDRIDLRFDSQIVTREQKTSAAGSPKIAGSR
jgi:cell division protein FtsQ